MKQRQALAPGTHVHGNDGSIGVVEQIAYRTTKSGKQPVHFTVRSDDGRERYRFPLTLVEQGISPTGQSPLTVTISRAALPQYRVAGPAAPEQVTPVTAIPGASSPSATTLRVSLAAEEVIVTTRPIQRGILHLHTTVATEEQAFTVLTTQEQVTIDHIPAAQFDAATMTAPEDIIIPVMEERLVVRKEQVITEYIRIHTERVTEPREVRATVRREILTIHPESLTNSPTPLVHLVDEEPH